MTEEKKETASPYEWAENPVKLDRAKVEVAEKQPKLKEGEVEEAVKVVYRRLLGRVIGEPARGSKEDNKLATKELLEEAREEGRKEGMTDEALDKIKEAAREEGREEIRKENSD